MRILHLIFQLRVGGTENLLVDLATRQAAAGNRVKIIVVNSGSVAAMLDRVKAPVELVCLDRPEGSRSVAKLLKLNLMVAAFRPDVIHVHNKRMVNMLVFPGLRGKVVQTLHALGIELTGCQLRTRLVAISEGVADDASRRMGVTAAVVKNGVSTSEIARREAPMPQAPRRGICVARAVMELKGQNLILEALQSNRGLEMTFVGDGSDLERLRRMANELGVADRTVFAGEKSRNEVYAMLRDFDFFVLASNHEGFGLVVAEAMVAGLPVITSNLPSVLEVTDGGRLGLTFDAGSAASLAEAMKKMTENWAECVARIPEARDFAIANFDADRTAAQYLKLYLK